LHITLQRTHTLVDVGIVNIDVDDRLHRRAKACAGLEGETLKQLVIRAVTAEVERLERKHGLTRDRR
jgi:predicted HicB family RNase H-like nuclease